MARLGPTARRGMFGRKGRTEIVPINTARNRDALLTSFFSSPGAEPTTLIKSPVSYRIFLSSDLCSQMHMTTCTDDAARNNMANMRDGKQRSRKDPSRVKIRRNAALSLEAESTDLRRGPLAERNAS